MSDMSFDVDSLTCFYLGIGFATYQSRSGFTSDFTSLSLNSMNAAPSISSSVAYDKVYYDKVTNVKRVRLGL